MVGEDQGSFIYTSIGILTSDTRTSNTLKGDIYSMPVTQLMIRQLVVHNSTAKTGRYAEMIFILHQGVTILGSSPNTDIIIYPSHLTRSPDSVSQKHRARDFIEACEHSSTTQGYHFTSTSPHHTTHDHALPFITLSISTTRHTAQLQYPNQKYSTASIIR